MIALWVVAAAALSVVTTRVTDWFVMTDELIYERLAINVARSLSPLPIIHGVTVRSLDQLYPVLIAPFFRYGHVSADLIGAHLFNAWVMTSACIPAFLLARRVTERRWAAYVLAALTLCLPWLIYAPFLLTEVASYPVILWALLAFQRAIVEPSRRNDRFAIGALVLAFLARTQFVFLVAVLPIAVIASERSLRRAFSRHRSLATFYGVGSLVTILFVVAGGRLLSLSVYGNQVHGHLVSLKTFESFAGHAADLSFGLGILPFLIGAAWLLANTWQSSGTTEQRTFACIGSATVVLLLFEAASYDSRSGNFVRDRYLFYLVPVLLLGVLCALLDSRRPGWSLLGPACLVAVGFATNLQASFTWGVGVQLNADSPIATMYHPIAHAAGSRTGAATALVIATGVLMTLFLIGADVLGHRLLLGIVLGLILIGLPVETGYTFNRLLTTDGYSGRPLTRPIPSEFSWLDQQIGPNAHATAIPYVTSTDFFATQRYWRDFEFWNKSVGHDAYYPTGQPYSFLGIWLPKTVLSFDELTGAVNVSPSRYAVQSVTESRFRISGPMVASTPEVMVIDAGSKPWRLYWLTFKLYDDGWTQPDLTARIRVYRAAGQQGARIRTLTFQVQAPDGPSLPFFVDSNQGIKHSIASSTHTTTIRIQTCVSRTYDDVYLRSPISAAIPGDLSSVETETTPRKGGIHIADIALADEIGPRCKAS